LPFHALLALFFIYPPVAAHLAARPDDRALTWFLFSFSGAAAVLLLTTIPAARRGPAYVADNGTPWGWPMYPGTLFVVLALGIVGRARYLCYSFHAAPDGHSIFGPYFAVPLFFALGTIMLAAGRDTRTRILALIIPAASVLLAGAYPQANFTFDGFLYDFTKVVGCGPPAAALWAGIAFYAFAMMRRVPGAAECLFGAVVLTSVIRGPTWIMPTLDTMPAWPFVGGGLMASALAVWRDQVRWAWLACACLAAASAALVRDVPNAPVALASLHVFLVAAATFGLYFGNRHGAWLRAAAAVALVVAFTEAVTGRGYGLFRQTPGWATYYPAFALALAVSYAAVRRDRATFAFAVALAMEWLGFAGVREYARWRKLVPGLDAVVLGLVTFAAGVVVSLLKIERLALAPVRRQTSTPERPPEDGPLGGA
jgi:hypothetical protein